MDGNQNNNVGIPTYYLYYPFYYANQWPTAQYPTNFVETRMNSAPTDRNGMIIDENEKKNENQQTLMEIPTLSLDWSLNYCMENTLFRCNPSNIAERKTE